MWPNAASVQEARKHAEEEAARRKALRTDQPDEEVSKPPIADSQPAEDSNQQEPQAEAASASGPKAGAEAEREAKPEAEDEASTQHSGERVRSDDVKQNEHDGNDGSRKRSETSPDADKGHGREASARESAFNGHTTQNPRISHSQPLGPKGPKQGKMQKASHAKPKRPQKDARRKTYKKELAIGGVVVAALIVLIVVMVNLVPITVTVNGQQVQVAGTKTLSTAMDKAGLKPTAGNFLAVDGSVITEGGGQPFDATVGNEKTSDPDYKLSDGAVVNIDNGSDIMEDFTVATGEAPFTATVDGIGAIHTLSGTGQNGEQEVKTGSVSGLQSITVTTDPVNVVCMYHNSNVGDQKVVALTFDDGPNADYTPQILDILERNGASATFFTIGSRISGDCVDIVQRAYNAGHQISTHSWDHAAGSGNGVDLSHMSTEEQVDEILKGYEAIEAAIGVEASHAIRTPGGNFPPEVIANLSPYITSEIGWNIDTQDWRKPGVAAIKSEILSAKAGDIILMHDGGGDRSQTVQALSEALPVLKERGFRFVTINQLLEITAENS